MGDSKQATVYCIDLGSSTGECRNGRTETDLDYGLKYFWSKIGDTMAANRKGWAVGVIGFRTDETKNPTAEDDPEAYRNISILKPLGPIELSHADDLRGKLVCNETTAGDALSAIVVATQLILDFTTLKTGKLGKFDRKIVVLTDGHGAVDADGLDEIAQKIKEVEINLVVIGVDFDDTEYGFKEEDKPEYKLENENIFKDLVEKCGDNGVFGTAAEAIENLSIPTLKATRPYKCYEGRLGLGDFEAYPETALYIDVVRYFKTKKATPPSASSFVVKSSVANGGLSGQSSHTLPIDVEMTDAHANDNGLAAVRSAFTYKVNDPSMAGGKRDVDRDELSKGYAYGSTAVPITELEENITKLETTQSFSIVGFVPCDDYEKYFNMSESCITIAQPMNVKAHMALSSLIHALHELESYAVARIVAKDGKDPLLLLLAPVIEPDLEALVDVPLPFAEDLRIYRFPPLDRVITTSGASLLKHRNLPTEELTKAMSDYVDAMDLSTFAKDEDGDPMEYITIEETYSPAVHRINQAIRDRAVHPTNPISPPAEVLTKYSTPPSDLVLASAPQLRKLVEAASVKKVPPKVKGKRGRREVVKPLSGLDVDSLLSRDKRQKISEENAIPEFKQMLATTTTDNAILDAANQMGEIIRGMVTKSFAEEKYPLAIEYMKVLREELIDFEMPEIYNDFIKEFKKRLFKGELGGNRKELFETLKQMRLGLIDKRVLEISDVSEEDAREVLNPEVPLRINSLTKFKFYSIKTDLPTRNR